MRPLVTYGGRNIASALIWGAAVFLFEFFVVIVNGSLLSTSTFYLALAVAAGAAILTALAVYLSEPKLWRARYRIAIEAPEVTRGSFGKALMKDLPQLDRAIISEGTEKGYILPADLARKYGTTVYSIVERIYELEKDGMIKATKIEPIE